MSSSPSHPPYPAFSPYLCVHDAAAAIEYYKTAFGATERFRLINKTNGKIGHAELDIQGVLIMLADENPAWGNLSPKSLGGTSTTFCLEVEDPDATIDRVVAAGATIKMPLDNQFYGFRSGSVIDPFGHEWMIQREIEKVSPEELQKRWDAISGDCSNDQKK